MDKKVFNIEGTPKVTCQTDYRDIRIYINDILHIIIPRPNVDNESRDSIKLQSYYVGSRKSRRYFIEVGSGDLHDYYGYDNANTWKEILRLLDENI